MAAVSCVHLQLNRKLFKNMKKEERNAWKGCPADFSRNLKKNGKVLASLVLTLKILFGNFGESVTERTFYFSFKC